MTSLEADSSLARVTLDDVRAAANRLRGVALRTPLLPFREGAFIKPESLQPTGSFKIRGAYSALASLSDDERSRGVVAHSSGNHAQAIARAGRLLGIRVVVVMPSNAPRIKIAGVERDAAEIVFVGPHNSERVKRAHDMADSEGLVLIPSANHPAVIAGQGTAGLEIVEQLGELGIDGSATVLTPIGLGGLAAGMGVAVRSLRPDWRVIGVEPTLAADTRDSLERGELVAWRPEDTGRTIADGLRGESPAEIAFALMRDHVSTVVTVDEREIVDAMRIAAREAKLVLEPSGAASLAAFLHRRAALPDTPIVILASGGNVDPELYAEWLRG
ncbi:MAG: threonine/serine dehydratase [Candidatus Limnocylindrales bacterium]